MMSASPCLFTEQFISDQRKLLVQASAKQGAVREVLFNEKDLNNILDVMRQVTVPSSPLNNYDIALGNLGTLILQTASLLGTNSNNIHTVRALSQIYRNIDRFAQYSGLFLVERNVNKAKQVSVRIELAAMNSNPYQSPLENKTDAIVSVDSYRAEIKQLDEDLENDLKKIDKDLFDNLNKSPKKMHSLATTVEPAVLENKTTTPLMSVQNPASSQKHLVNTLFIDQQRNFLLAASQACGQRESILLNEDVLEPILTNMSKLTVSGNKISVSYSNVNYRYLLAQIDDAMHQFQSNYKKSNSCVILDHPMKQALQKVKENFIAAAKLSASQAIQEENKASQERGNKISTARWTKVGDVVGIIACGLWCVPEKILSCNNFCNGCCGERSCNTREADCDNCPPCAPKNTIESLKSDLTKQSTKILILQDEERGGYKPSEMNMR